MMHHHLQKLKNMAQVRFYLPNINARGNRFIYCRYWLPRGVRLEKSLGNTIKIPKEDWNKTTQSVRASNAHYKKINLLLNRLRVALEAAAIDAATSGRPITVGELTDVFNQIMGFAPTASARTTTVLQFAQRRATEQPNPRRKNFVTHIEKYQALHDGKTLYFEDLDVRFFDKFKAYLIANNLKDSYIDLTLKTLKMTVREASGSRYKITKFKEVLEFETGMSSTQPPMQYLTFDDLEKLYKLRLTNSTMAQVRDCFLCACLTGLRFDDWHKLDTNRYKTITTSHFEFLEIPTTAKTGVNVFVPLFGMTEEILKRYGGRLPGISMQKTNEYIKEICKLAGMTEEIVTQEKRAGKVNEIRFLKWEKISTHTGRRTLATMLKNCELKEEYINLITGWKVKKTMAQYYDKSSFLAIANREDFYKPLLKLNGDLLLGTGMIWRR